jgi:hypothetical protein
MSHEGTPQMAVAERIPVSVAKPVLNTPTGSPTVFADGDYLTATVSEKKRKSPVKAEEYIPTAKHMFTSAYKNKTKLPRFKTSKNRRMREVVDVDIHKVNKVCKKIGLDLEQFAISEIEANLLTELIRANSELSTSKNEVLAKYCIIREVIHELQPKLENEKPYAYYYLLAIPGGLVIEEKIKKINDIEGILNNNAKLGQLNRSSKAIDFYNSLKFKYYHGVRIGLHPRISALNELEGDLNNGPSQFRIRQEKGGRYTRKTKGSKRKSRKSNK